MARGGGILKSGDFPDARLDLGEDSVLGAESCPQLVDELQVGGDTVPVKVEVVIVVGYNFEQQPLI